MLLCALACCGEPQRAERLREIPIRLAPVDSVRRGELAESDEEAFGVALPRHTRVEARGSDTVYARLRGNHADVVRFYQDRLLARRVETGPRKTVFVDAAPKGGDGSHIVKLTVIDLGSTKLRLIVRDRRKRKPQEGLTEAERWRAAGLTPDGQVIQQAAE